MDVIVLGAGIVGVSAAYAARQRGLSVIVVDRREPGSETSYGNAGMISSRLDLSAQPALAARQSAEIPEQSARRVALEYRAGRCAIPDWVMRFLASARASQTRPRALALHGLIGASLKLHRDWIVKAGAAERIRETGWLKAWRSDNRRRGEGGAGRARRIWHQERAARPPGDLRARAEHPAGLQASACCTPRPRRWIRRATW